MPIKRLSQTSLVSFQKHSNMLAGNAAYIPNSYDLLETTVLSSSAKSVTFSSLGSYSAYKHLQLRVVATHTSTGGDNLDITLNSDTGNNYAYHQLGGNGSVVFSEASTSRANMASMLQLRASTNQFAAGVIDILDFSSSSKNTTVRSLNGIAGTSGNIIGLVSGLWNNTAAVTSITLTMRTNNIAAGSRFSLYGIKG